MRILFRNLQRAAVFALLCAVLISAGLMPKASAADVTSAAGLITTATGALNVRSEARTDAAVITKLPSGSYVTLIT